jgi:hypothetical protein
MLYFEGGKPYSALYFLVILAEFMEVTLIQILLLGLLTYYYLKYYFYEITVFDKGDYDIGFRSLKMGEQELAVFYPTKEKGEPALWMQTKDYLSILYDLTFIDPLKLRWVPLPFFKLCTSYMAKAKMPVQTNASLYKLNP